MAGARPTSDMFTTPSGASRPFHQALAEYLQALGWTEYDAAEAFQRDGLGVVRNGTVNRWKMGPERPSGQVPIPSKQRAIIDVLSKAWTRHEKNRKRREARARRQTA